MQRWQYTNDSRTFTHIKVGDSLLSVSPATTKLFNAHASEYMELIDLPEPWPTEGCTFASGRVDELCEPAE